MIELLFLLFLRLMAITMTLHYIVFLYVQEATDKNKPKFSFFDAIKVSLYFVFIASWFV